jgi:phage baseplate assembly protein V
MNNPVAARMRRSIQNMVGRAILSAIDDSTGIQSLQIEGLADEIHDNVERLQDYGFTSVPLAGAEAAVVFVGGLRSHGLVVAVGDRRYRIKGLKPGEVAVYDDQEQQIVLTRDGIEIRSPKKVTVEAEGELLVKSAAKVTVEAPAVDLGGAGGKAVARVGDPVANGVITAGSAKVKAA